MDSFPKGEGRDGALQVIPRISPRRLYVLSHISPESQYHIDNNRGTHRQQGCVDKILADAARCNAHAVANSGTPVFRNGTPKLSKQGQNDFLLFCFIQQH